MKILLTGASGLLGAAFAIRAQRRKHDVVGITGSYQGAVSGLSRQIQIDLRDSAKVEQFVLQEFPDVIVNCAAMSNAQSCDAQPDDSHRLNVELPEQLAKLARHLFAPFIHISTLDVFDGANAPYKIDSPASPPSLYASQKAEAETRTLNATTEFSTILRLPLLNGNSLGGERSLHEQLLKAWHANQRPTLFTDEIRQPCHADNAAQAMLEICERDDVNGICHWAGAQSLSRYEIGERLLQRLGLPADWIVRARQSDDPRFANRAPNLSADLQPLLAKLKVQPEGFATQMDFLNIPKALQSWYNQI